MRPLMLNDVVLTVKREQSSLFPSLDDWLLRQGGNYMGASFFQQILERSLVLCRRRVGTLGSCRQRKIFSGGVCSSLFYKVQSPVDSDGEDLEEEPLIRHLSLKGKSKAIPEDEKLPDSAVAGDDEIAAVPSSEKCIGTFTSPIGGGKGVNDPGSSEP
ncbi:hypothetical protein ACOSQ3_009504 [Xanthoceras sorbifolium]